MVSFDNDLLLLLFLPCFLPTLPTTIAALNGSSTSFSGSNCLPITVDDDDDDADDADDVDDDEVLIKVGMPVVGSMVADVVGVVIDDVNGGGHDVCSFV